MLTFCVLLWATEGCADDLARFEDEVLLIMGEHGGTVVSRVRAAASCDHPNEVQVVRFASDQGLASYMADPRRVAMVSERDRVVARTVRFDVVVL